MMPDFKRFIRKSTGTGLENLKRFPKKFFSHAGHPTLFDRRIVDINISENEGQLSKHTEGRPSKCIGSFDENLFKRRLT